MKKFAVLLFSLLITAGPASAITQSSTPPKFNIPWGNGAGVPYIRSIPQGSQIGITSCAASLTDGFPPLTFTPPGAGGCPPFGADFNGILQQITQWSRWYSAGGPIFYDATFAGSASNGYPNGAIVQSTIVPGDFWLSTADNNTTNPDAGGANWVPLPSAYQTGDVKWVWGSTIPTGWVLAGNGWTIGSASSSATVASTTTQFLYALLWNNCSNTLCPVSTGRGANSSSDFSANKTITVLPLSGTMLIANDFGNGTLTGVPVISGSGSGTNTSIIGEVLHTLTVGQLPSHTHNYNGTTSGESATHTHGYQLLTTANITGGGIFPAGAGTTGSNTGTESNGHTHTYSGTTDVGTGGQGAANNTPRSMVGYWVIKL